MSVVPPSHPAVQAALHGTTLPRDASVQIVRKGGDKTERLWRFLTHLLECTLNRRTLAIAQPSVQTLWRAAHSLAAGRIDPLLLDPLQLPTSGLLFVTDPSLDYSLLYSVDADAVAVCIFLAASPKTTYAAVAAELSDRYPGRHVFVRGTQVYAPRVLPQRWLATLRTEEDGGRLWVVAGDGTAVPVVERLADPRALSDPTRGLLPLGRCADRPDEQLYWHRLPRGDLVTLRNPRRPFPPPPARLDTGDLAVTPLKWTPKLRDRYGLGRARATERQLSDACADPRVPWAVCGDLLRRFLHRDGIEGAVRALRGVPLRQVEGGEEDVRLVRVCHRVGAALERGGVYDTLSATEWEWLMECLDADFDPHGWMGMMGDSLAKLPLFMTLTSEAAVAKTLRAGSRAAHRLAATFLLETTTLWEERCYRLARLLDPTCPLPCVAAVREELARRDLARECATAALLAAEEGGEGKKRRKKKKKKKKADREGVDDEGVVDEEVDEEGVVTQEGGATQEGVAESAPTLDRAAECVVCLDGMPTYAVLPCGHLCLCAACRPAACPLCRVPVDRAVRIYHA